LEKKVIVAVDDDADNNFSLKLRLEQLDSRYEVIAVESGKKCIEFLENNEIPDIILLDIMMPEMSGWDVFVKLKENSSWRKIPVVFLSAKTDSYSKGFGKIPSGGYIEKPYDVEDVKKRIDEIFENASQK